MAGTKSRFPDNKFNFLRFNKITGGQISDLPITDVDPIDLDTISPTTGAYYYGTTLLTDLTGAQILADGITVASNGDGAITLPFPAGAGVNLWFWFPDSASTKTTWTDPANALNSGDIGGVGDLFLSPTAKTVDTVDGQFYITELLQLSTTLTVE